MGLQNLVSTKTNTSQSIFSALFQNMFDGVLMYNYLTDEIKLCNHSLTKILGYTEEELLQLNHFDLMPNESVLYPNIKIHEIIHKVHRRKVLAGESILSKGELTKKNGESIYAEINIVPFEKGTGNAFIIIHDITKDLEHQKTIEKNKKEYELIFNNAKESILFFDLKTSKLIRCNNVVKSMFGVESIEEFLESNYSKFFAEDKSITPYSYRFFFKKGICEAIRNDISKQTFLGKKLNGETFVAEITIVFIKSEGTKVVFFIKDISTEYYAQKDKEKIYREQSQILEAMPIQFSQKDLNSNFVKCNKAMRQFLNIEGKETIGKNIFELVDKEVAIISNEEEQEVLRSKKDFFKKVVHVEKDSKDFWGQIVKLPLLDEKKKVSGVLTYVTDISELMKTQELIKDSEENYRALFDNAFDGIMVYECEHNEFVRCNLHLAEFLNSSPDNVINNLLDYFSPEFQSNGLRSIQHFNYIVAKTKKNGKYETEWNFLDKSGNPLISELISFLLPSKKDIVFIFKDITERKEREIIIRNNVKELNEKNEELKKYIESNKQLDNFAAVASHDLQAPLRTIYSFTQLLQKSIEKDATPLQKEYMHFITNATNSMRELIRDLRVFSKVDVTKIQIHSIISRQMIEEVVSELKASLEYKNAILSIPEDMPIILGDRVKLKQLFQNFFTNALKYIDDDAQPRIQVAFEENDSEWKFLVKDNGIGISKENQEKVFQLFTRLHGAQEYSGTGIGLSLCKKVVEQHFGAIGVDSEVGQGSTFHFTIPKNIQERYKDFS